jgi:endonuclease/exonuclease/phosphatase (EEP) superfamily protein YafD
MRNINSYLVSTFRKHEKKLSVSCFWGILAWIFIVILIRLTVRDRIPLVSSVYYAMPPFVLGALAFFGTIVLIVLKKYRSSFVFLFIGALCAVWWFSSNYYSNPESAAESDIRLLSWNIQKRTGEKADDAVRILKENNPDIFSLIEFGEGGNEALKKLKSMLPDYSLALIDDCILIGAKGAIKTSKLRYAGNDDFGRYVRAELLVYGQEILVYFVDMGSSPHHPRESALADIFSDAMAEDKKSSLVMMGDFNTPYDSLWFEPYKKHFKNAFAESGEGFMESWPLPLCLLTIDHIWCGSNLKPVNAKLLRNRISDHKIAVAGILIRADKKF